MKRPLKTIKDTLFYFDYPDKMGNVIYYSEYIKSNHKYLTDRATKKTLIGRFSSSGEHKSFNLELSHASHIVSKITIDKKEHKLEGTIKILNNYNGVELKNLYEECLIVFRPIIINDIIVRFDAFHKNEETFKFKN